MKKLDIIKKIINHLMKNGEKNTSEKLFLQSFKELQKNSSKETQKLIKLAVLNTTPIFKLHKIKNKNVKKNNDKEVPSFIANRQSKISLAIKFILKSVKKKSESFYKKFKEELLLNSQNKGDAVKIKNDLQEQILQIKITNKRYFNFYRWG
jgi:ribosomal protein S7